MESFPECLPLIPRLRKADVAVEQELAALQAEASGYPERHRQLAAIRYYLRLALWECQDRWKQVHHGITNYATLLDEIERWRVERKEQVCFVTFNYDTMLEEAMVRFLHLSVKDMNSYHSWKNYSLFKLHGSVDWGLELDGIRHPGNNAPYPYLNLIDLVTPGSPHLTKRYRLCTKEMGPTPDRVVVFPALSIPVEKKDEFSCPSGHVTALEAMLPRVTKMITIGWRASEEEFLKMLLASRMVVIPGIRREVELLVVTGSREGAEQTVKNLAAYGVNQGNLPNPDRARVTTGFTGLINNLETLGVFLRKGMY